MKKCISVIILLFLLYSNLKAQTTYLWSNGATTPTIEVNPSQTTTYYVTVTESGNTYHDSLVVYVSQPPTISGAYSVCEFATTQLSANATPAIYNPWMSFDQFSASVTNTGLVTGKAEGGGNTAIYFRSAEGCEVTYGMSIPMADPPIFNQVGPYTVGSTIPDLPTTSKFGLFTGTWSPEINNLATTTYLFIPDSGQCALSTSMTIVIEPVSYVLSASDSSVCAGEQVNLSVNSDAVSGPLKVGDAYGGGVIGYIFQPGDNEYIEGETHGIVVSTMDIVENSGSHPQWGCRYESLNLNTYTATPLHLLGYVQTNVIVAKCKEAGIAARLCYQLVSNGYSDWFLPSVQELQQVYNNRLLINSTINTLGGSLMSLWAGYWTSSTNCSSGGNCPAYINFWDGTVGYESNSIGSYAAHAVRAVRAF